MNAVVGDDIETEIRALGSTISPRRRFAIRRVGGGWIVVDVANDLVVTFTVNKHRAVIVKQAMRAEALAGRASSTIPLARLAEYRAWLETEIAKPVRPHSRRGEFVRNFLEPKLEQVRLLILAGEEPFYAVKARALRAIRELKLCGE